MIEMKLSELDLRRIKSGLFDYRKQVQKHLPAETTVPTQIDELIQRIDFALSYINEAGADGQQSIPV